MKQLLLVGAVSVSLESAQARLCQMAHSSNERGGGSGSHEVAPAEEVDVDQALRELSDRPPYYLDYTNLERSIEALMNAHPELRQPYKSLKDIERAHRTGAVDAKTAYHLSSGLAQDVARRANQEMRSAPTDKQRSALEAQRILLSRLQRLQRQARDELVDEKIEQEEKQEQAREEREEKDQSPAQSEELTEQAEKQTQQRQQPQKKSSLEDLAKEMNRQMSKQKQRPADPKDVQQKSDSEIKDLSRRALEELIKQAQEKQRQQEQQEQPGEQQSGEQQQSREQSEQDKQETSPETDKAIQDRLQEMIDKEVEKEKAKRPPREKSKGKKEQESEQQSENGEKQEGQEQEGQEGQPEGQQDGQQGKQQESRQGQEQGQGQEEQQQGKPKGQQSGEGREGQPGEEQDQQSQQQGRQEGQQQGRQEGQQQGGQEGQQQGKQEGQQQGKQQGQQRGEGQEGQPGDQQGRPEQQRGQSQAGKPGEGEKSEGQEGQHDRKRGQDSDHKQAKKRDSHGEKEQSSDSAGDETGSKELTQSLKELLKGLKDAEKRSETTDPEKLKREELERERNRKRDRLLNRKEQRREKEEKVPEANLSQNVSEILEQTWQQVLGQYQNSEAFLKQLSDFASICQSFAVRRSDFAHVLKQYAAKANDLSEALRKLDVQYRDIEEFGFSLSGGSNRAHLVRRIRFIEQTLSAREQSRILTEHEERTLLIARNILAAVDGHKVEATNEEIAKAFRDQLLGPLSRGAIDSTFPATSAREEFNTQALVEALRSGQINDLALFSKLSPYVNILLNDIYKPSYYERHEGKKEPINESDSVIERAEDFEDIPHIIKEGNPAELDVMRLLSGDLLKNTYQEKVRKPDPRKPIPKRASIVLYDISGSMRDHQKEVLRNAILNAFLDRSQAEVARGEGMHTVYLIPFDGRAHEPRIIADIHQAKAAFDEMRAHPIGSSGGTSITDGLVKAYELIAKHQESGGDLQRGNILLITDAADTIDLKAVEAARSKIDPEVDLALNAITTGDWNDAFTEMIKKYSINGNGEIGKVSHQHIPYDEIPRLLDSGKEINEIVKSAKNYNRTLNGSIPEVALQKLRGSVLGIAGQRESAERIATVQLSRWVKKLKERRPSTSQKNQTVVQLVEEFLETATGSIGRNWTSHSKLASWEGFLEIAEKQGIEPHVLLSQLSEQHIQVLLRWLEK